MSEEELARSDFNWTLSRRGGRLVLAVLCGTIGLYEEEVVLTDAERARWEGGEERLPQELATRVRKDPEWLARRKAASP